MSNLQEGNLVCDISMTLLNHGHFFVLEPQLTSSATSEPRKYPTKYPQLFIIVKSEKVLHIGKWFLIHLESKLNHNDMGAFFCLWLFNHVFVAIDIFATECENVCFGDTAADSPGSVIKICVILPFYNP